MWVFIDVVVNIFNNLLYYYMKVYIAKDWTGVWVFANQPHLSENFGGVLPTWNGHKLTFFKLAEDWNDKLKINTFDEFNI